MVGTCPQIREDHLKKVTFQDEWGETEVWDASVCETRICAETNGREQKGNRQRDGAGEQRDRDGETEIKVKNGWEEIRRDYNEAVKFSGERAGGYGETKYTDFSSALYCRW